MIAWNFRVTLNRELTDDEVDALYEAGLGWRAGPGSCTGRVRSAASSKSPDATVRCGPRGVVSAVRVRCDQG